MQQAVKLAATGENMVVMGIQPHRPETGYGYIEAGVHARGEFLHVRRFTEKPNEEKAEEFAAAGNYYWNSGMFIWGARTLANAVREHLPDTAPHLQKIAAAYGTRAFEKTFARFYPKCENISVDYAILEPRSAKGEQHLTCSAFPRITAGTIWARGRRCMSIARATLRTATSFTRTPVSR